MDTQKFLDDLFEGKEFVKPPKRFLLVCSGKYSWCDDILEITEDSNGNPIPEPYYIGKIKIKDDGFVAHIIYDITDWYDFEPSYNVEDVTDLPVCGPKSETHVMFG